ncbi:hypothetical protein Q4580_23580, partial [Bacillus thuringiensis]|nr:hypothetical protein [Bacillus thuringiensis]MDO6661749.1 hypothetical protein [Bacillus thuringiensis]
NKLSIWTAYFIFCLAWFFSEMLAVPQKEGVQFAQPSSLVAYPIIEFIKHIAKKCKETIEI